MVSCDTEPVQIYVLNLSSQPEFGFLDRTHLRSIFRTFKVVTHPYSKTTLT
jgi:hypothetical protein